MKYYNSVSVIIGAVFTVLLCLIYLPLVPAEPIYWLSGIAAIIVLIFFAGYEKLPSVSQGILEIAGRRMPEIRFGEGWAWKLIGISKILQDSAQQKTLNIPPIEAMAKDNVEVKLNGIQLLAKVINPARILRLEGGLNALATLITGKAREAFREYVVEHSSAHCIRAAKEIQEHVQNRIKGEVEEFGIEITAVDIGPILEAEEIRTARRESKAKEDKTLRFVLDLKKIKKQAPGLTDSEATNITQVVEGGVKKEIQEKKTTFKLDVEPSILALIANFLPKRKEEKPEGDKK